jgi:hypothetical protein
MSEDQGPITLTEGQPAPTPTGTTGTAPTANTGPATSSDQTGQGQAQAPASPEQSFFDINAVDPSLLPAYKQMQSAFTKKMQDVSQNRQKIEAYDNFTRDPVGNMQAMAKQYGMTLTRAEAKEALNDAQASGRDWEPKSWDDVMSRAKKEVMNEVMQQFAPVMQNVQKLQAGNIEKQLAEIDPGWQQYEDDMRRELAAHPTLVNDVSKLYRLAVPEEVLTSRATQAALAKFQQKAESAKVSGTPSTSRSVPVPKKASSFQEAVDIAKEKCRQEGTYR